MTDQYSPIRDAAFSMVRTRYGNVTDFYESQTVADEQAMKAEADAINALLNSLDRNQLFILVTTLTQIGVNGLIAAVDPDFSGNKVDATLDQWRTKLA